MTNLSRGRVQVIRLILSRNEGPFFYITMPFDAQASRVRAPFDASRDFFRRGEVRESATVSARSLAISRVTAERPRNDRQRSSSQFLLLSNEAIPPTDTAPSTAHASLL